MDREGFGPWADFCRIMLFADSLIYTAALLPLLWVPRARVLLLRTQALTILRVFKLITTPLETLVVVHGIFGLGFRYKSRPPARTKMLGSRSTQNASNSNQLASQSAVGSETEEEAEGEERMLQEFAKDQVNMVMLWTL